LPITVEVGLPVVTRLNVQAGEPPASAGVGVDADRVAEVERDMRLLCGMPADHDLAGLVRRWLAELLVDDGEGRLVTERQVRLKVGVDEDVGVRLEVGEVLAQELPVRFG
jgi:hypothetical protein